MAGRLSATFGPDFFCHSAVGGCLLGTAIQHTPLPRRSWLAGKSPLSASLLSGISALEVFEPMSDFEATELGTHVCRRKQWGDQLHKALWTSDTWPREGTPMLDDAVRHLFRECEKEKDVSLSCLFHSLLVSMGLDTIGFLGDQLIRLYSSCGNLAKGCGIFCKNPHPTLYSWNAILAAHAQLESFDKVLNLFQIMNLIDVEPDKFTFLAVTRASGRLLDIRQARLLHGHVIEKGFETDLVVSSAIVDMFAKCHCMQDARHVFDSLVKRDAVVWNTMIGGYVQSSDYASALQLIEKMQGLGLALSDITYSFLIKACSRLGGLKECNYVVHDLIVRQGLESTALVANSLVDMYAKCGSLDVARKLFDSLTCRDSASWNSLIAGYVQHGSGWLGLHLFQVMQQAGAKPDKFTFSSSLQACGSVGALELGKVLHSLIIESEFEGNLVVKKMLIDMYAKCGSLSDGCNIFADLQKDGDVVPWNSIIAGYTLRGDSAAAVVLFEKMQRQGIRSDDITYSWVLKAYANEGDFQEGKVLHDEVIRRGFESNECIGSALVEMYALCGSLSEAQEVFDRIPHKDLVLWNALIAGYTQAQKALVALGLFKELQFKEIRPDDFTFSCTLKACGDIKDVESGRLIHDQLLQSEFEGDIVIGNALVDMYSKFGNVEESYCVFQRLTNRDVVSWNTIIFGTAQQEKHQCVLELFQRMQEESIQPDEPTYTCVLKACGSTGAIREGRLVHDQVIRRGLETNISVKNHIVEMYIQSVSLQEGSKIVGTVHMEHWVPWNAMIVGHALHGSGLSAFEWFVDMCTEGVQAEKHTYLAVMKACSGFGATLQGMFIHDHMIRNGREIDMIVGSSLVDMYAKCGNIEEASAVFLRLPNRDVVSWNAMIAGYTRHGDYTKAKNCLEEMKEHGLKPDERTYSSVLALCSRAGKAEEGHCYLESMKESFDVSPDDRHFTCMVDLLSRAGKLDQAEELLKSLPCLPDVHGWRALLSACRAHGGKDLGKECYRQAVLSNPENSSGYVLMSNICADANMLEDAQEIQEQRVVAGAWKMPGKSWIEVKRCVYEFIVGEKALPQRDLVHMKLKTLSRLIVSEGYVPQVSSVLRWVPDEGRTALHSAFPEP